MLGKTDTFSSSTRAGKVKGKLKIVRAVILNSGPGAWAFEAHAERLSRALWLPVSSVPAEYCYLLGWEGAGPPGGSRLFIPWEAIGIAADKRRVAEAFLQAHVPAPVTHLPDSPEEVRAILASAASREWVLKWPTGCGAGGHRRLTADQPVPEDWPRPYVLQEFIRLERPEVYRLYGAAGEIFGWNARRYPRGVEASPWVAHARGARYEIEGPAPAEAEAVARQALAATGLLDSFGCVDLLPAPEGRWLALEVGTDGVFNHVDRDVGDPALAEELDRRVAEAFWSGIGDPPWAPGP